MKTLFLSSQGYILMQKFCAICERLSSLYHSESSIRQPTLDKSQHLHLSPLELF